jgi:hypothetical protein
MRPMKYEKELTQIEGVCDQSVVKKLLDTREREREREREAKVARQ